MRKTATAAGSYYQDSDDSVCSYLTSDVARCWSYVKEDRCINKICLAFSAKRGLGIAILAGVRRWDRRVLEFNNRRILGLKAFSLLGPRLCLATDIFRGCTLSRTGKRALRMSWH